MARVICGDSLHILPTLEAESVDAIVCDPPYGLSFMGKEWDHGVPGEAFWREALRVAKPGAHLLAFGGTRTYHRLACAIEDAGWEIRDCLSWLYGSGFPKSHNLDGDWQGWGTALKPAWEPIIVARKPLVGTVASNVAQYGTGAINVDGCRIEGVVPQVTQGPSTSRSSWDVRTELTVSNPHPAGRWPANVVLDEEAAGMLDAQTGVQKSGIAGKRNTQNGYGGGWGPIDYVQGGYGDTGGASRFFYTAKASRREREAGLEGMPKRTVQTGLQDNGGRRTDAKVIAANVHPTVKPIALMRWLCRLVTPTNGLVLDPFTGSGSTGAAAVLEGFRFIGVEREPEYAVIAEKRIAYWASQRDGAEPSLFSEAA